ncbi:MAG TPA: hypothetical protein P5511_03335, partial [Candidatus Goldiibacteriota bacterium]|nr:hypothetical protein [Candidatus Goldiibacteriota bacterium]
LAAMMSAHEGQKAELEIKAGLSEKLAAELNAVLGKAAGMEASLRGADEKLGANAGEYSAISEKTARLSKELKSIHEGRVLKEEEIRNIKESEEALIREKMRKKEALEAFDNTVKEHGLCLSRLETRLGILKKMHEQMAGYGETVRKVLTEYRQQLEETKRAAIFGAAGNLMKVEKRFETAVERAFRDVLQTVLVDDPEIADEILVLYELEKGNVSVLDASRRKNDMDELLSSWRTLANTPGITAYLPDVISVEKGHEAVKLLFFNIFISEDMESAKKALLEVNSGRLFHILTLDGKLLSNYGVYKKGESEGGVETGFLSREREISEIENEIKMAAQKHISLLEERSAIENGIADLESRIEELSVVYHNQYVEVIKDDERLKQRKQELSDLETLSAKLSQEKTAIEAEKSRLMAELESLSVERNKMEMEISTLKDSVDSIKNAIMAGEERINSQKSNLEEARFSLHRSRSGREIEENNARMVEMKITEVEAAYASTNAEIEQLIQRANAAEEEKKQAQESISSNRSMLAQAEAELESVKEKHAAFKLSMETMEATIKEAGRERDRLKEEQYGIRLKINELSLQIRAIYEKIQAEYKVSLTEEEIYAVNVTEDEYKELSFKVAEFREKMDKLGVINLVAIEEYNELKKRNEFLQSQYDDLIQARDNLNKVIKKTNEESKELFNKAFVEIRSRFAEVFKKMMNGGEADLLLTGEEDVLSAGIDIIARPPGKRPQNISLLSGGEKSITAVSLLFALFLIKASPFCIMDEVDAALDDINVARFTNLIKSFRKTQFLIISHNKLTMETADVIYGVSMEKAGVSQIMSVKLDKISANGEVIGDGK